MKKTRFSPLVLVLIAGLLALSSPLGAGPASADETSDGIGGQDPPMEAGPTAPRSATLETWARILLRSFRVTLF